MDRRGFFSRLLGIGAAAAVAKVLPAESKKNDVAGFLDAVGPLWRKLNGGDRPLGMPPFAPMVTTRFEGFTVDANGVVRAQPGVPCVWEAKPWRRA